MVRRKGDVVREGRRPRLPGRENRGDEWTFTSERIVAQQLHLRSAGKRS